LSQEPTGIEVVASNELAADDPHRSIDLERWKTLARAALDTEGCPAGEFNLIFIGEAAMTELNIEHMEGTGPTDVLAFPLDAVPELDDTDTADVDYPGGAPRLLGDVLICPAVAAQNAATAGHSIEDEIALLTVHGVLHVLGHDHADPDETALMKSREQALLNAHYR